MTRQKPVGQDPLFEKPRCRHIISSLTYRLVNVLLRNTPYYQERNYIIQATEISVFNSYESKEFWMQ